MKTVYFIRHAESEGNARGILTGQLDLPLTPAGQAAAREASEHWQQIKPETIYCSTLQRTQQTARLLFPNAVIRVDSRLNERCWGIWQGRSKGGLRAEFPRAFLSNGQLCPSFTPLQGESQQALCMRLEEFIFVVAAESHWPIVCVTHAGIIRSLAHSCCPTIHAAAFLPTKRTISPQNPFCVDIFPLTAIEFVFPPREDATDTFPINQRK